MQIDQSRKACGFAWAICQDFGKTICHVMIRLIWWERVQHVVPKFFFLTSSTIFSEKKNNVEHDIDISISEFSGVFPCAIDKATWWQNQKTRSKPELKLHGNNLALQFFFLFPELQRKFEMGLFLFLSFSFQVCSWF